MFFVLAMLPIAPAYCAKESAFHIVCISACYGAVCAAEPGQAAARFIHNFSSNGLVIHRNSLMVLRNLPILRCLLRSGPGCR